MTAWQHEAACLEEDPELFFPIGNTGPAILQIEDAKAVCRRCDVISTCLRWAIDSGQDAGVWGGMSEDERRSFKRQKRTEKRREARASNVREPVAKATPRPGPGGRASVPPGPARTALLAAKEGRSWQEVAHKANLDGSAARAIASGYRSSILAETERRILAAWAPEAAR